MAKNCAGSNYIYNDCHPIITAVMTNDNHNPGATLLYDPNGNCQAGSGTACSALASSAQPFYFTGIRLDQETRLYYDRARC